MMRLTSFNFLYSIILLSFGLAVNLSASAQSDSQTTQQTLYTLSSNTPLRVLSWNVSGDSFVKHPNTFRAMVQKTQANLLILDEVSPITTPEQLLAALPELESTKKYPWHVEYGVSGGRQRGVIVSQRPIESLPELTEVVPYPVPERHKIYEQMEAANQRLPVFSLDEGIPMHGAVVIDNNKRLLVVAIDLQCCGNDPNSWQEYLRRVETIELRQRIRHVLERTHIDGIIIAGDFNLVGSALPLVYSSGPYPPPHNGLLVAELRQLDGDDMWTWDGRGTAFPSNTLDFQLYSPHSLLLNAGYIFTSEDLSLDEIEAMSIHTQSSKQLSDHLPLVTEFLWRK